MTGYVQCHIQIGFHIGVSADRSVSNIDFLRHRGQNVEIRVVCC
jgi:hypothetical protein